MTDVKSPHPPEWNGKYAVQVELFQNEFVWLQDDMRTVSEETQCNVMLFDSEENAAVAAKTWNTGQVKKYKP
jgi:hypothetical protein